MHTTIDKTHSEFHSFRFYPSMTVINGTWRASQTVQSKVVSTASPSKSKAKLRPVKIQRKTTIRDVKFAEIEQMSNVNGIVRVGARGQIRTVVAICAVKYWHFFNKFERDMDYHNDLKIKDNIGWVTFPITNARMFCSHNFWVISWKPVKLTAIEDRYERRVGITIALYYSFGEKEDISLFDKRSLTRVQYPKCAYVIYCFLNPI